MPIFRIVSSLLLALCLAAPVQAQALAVTSASVGSHGGHGGSNGNENGTAPMVGPVHHGGGFNNFPGSGHVLNYNPAIFSGFGVGGSYSAFAPSFYVIGQGGGFAPPPVTFFQPPPLGQVFGGGGPGGLMLPFPPRDFAAPAPARPRRPNPARSKELLEMGDRSFRSGANRHAEDRYHQAIKADPTSAAPHVHLAQIALVRGKYKEAADHLRDAVAAGTGTGWLANAPDIQALFSEPGDFAKQLGKLESHLQAAPSDRDAWFLLGVDWYLSGRTRQAADVFQRLADRQPDAALAAFLDLTAPPKPEAR